MRAWLLLLAVLATFQPFVQVASTEDISSRFIAAISPPSTATETRRASSLAHVPLKRSAPTTALTKAFNPVIDITSISTTTTSKQPSSSSLSPAAATSSSASSSSALLSSTSTSASSSSPYSAAEAVAASSVGETFLYKNSDSDNTDSEKHSHNQIDNNNNNIIIDIKNIKVIEEEEETNQINEGEKRLNANAQQLENSKNNNLTHRTNRKDDEKQQAIEISEKMALQNSVEQNNHHHNAASEHEHKKHRHHHTKHHHTTNHKSNDHQNAITKISSSDSTLPDEETTSQHSSLNNDNERLSTAHANDVLPAAADDDDGDDDDMEPATYSNKEIISEKVKPDPSTLVQIENSLLSLFNMKRPPKIDRSKIVIPEAMKQLYAQIMGHELDSVNIPKPGLLTKSANTVRSFTHQDSKIDDRFPHHHRFRLHFDIKSIPAEETLKAAELQLTRDAISHAALNSRLANRTRYQVLVYDITRVGIRGKREPNYLLLDNKTVRLNSTETVSLDVQPAVERWLATPKRNYGLMVEVRTMRSLKPAPHHHVRLRRSADEPHEVWQHKQPLLFTYTDDGRHKSRSIRDVSSRSKRDRHHRRSHRRKNQDEICRRHSLYVDFNDVGWSDWIVAPPGYDAYYCHGKCPFPLAEHLNSTNHAVVQTLVNNINPGKVPKACCVPTQLEGISMLYLNDQSTVVLKNYQDMTVVGCGCR